MFSPNTGAGFREPYHSNYAIPRLQNSASQVSLLSTPMGVDYVVIGFDMEVQPLVTYYTA